ncbi:MAG: cytochrome-c oxidase, cbb3-type subunit III [Proteobacteria bacterium]|nr:cytochrome-c oxidase, cbb3-type subunit III [Pseudomonadota bacterium]
MDKEPKSKTISSIKRGKTDQPAKTKSTQQEPQITGHEWDGITEYDNPDPMWLRVVFYCMLMFSLVYWILYPSWPTPHNNGVLGWSSYKELAAAQSDILKMRAKYQDSFDKASFADIMSNPELLRFAMAGGQSAFQNNCAVCHGAGGNGNPGYPNLTAGAWLWGGKIDDIYKTIQHGIRSGHDEARDSQMAAFGKDKILSPQQVWLLADYVRGLKERQDKAKAGDLSWQNDNQIQEADKLFQDNCSSCHGRLGEGNYDVGAPALNDAVWLYGNSRETIHDVINNGRGGIMPYWSGKLSESTIRQLAIYVHSLGGGQ